MTNDHGAVLDMHIQPANGRPQLYCSGRRQGTSCTSRSAALAIYEDQLAGYLSTFVLPADYQARLFQYLAHAHSPSQQHAAEQRRRLEMQVARLRNVYVLGHIDKARYLSVRERLKRELTIVDCKCPRQIISPQQPG